jgi:hypothetical protein
MMGHGQPRPIGTAAAIIYPATLPCQTDFRQPLRTFRTSSSCADTARTRRRCIRLCARTRSAPGPGRRRGHPRGTARRAGRRWATTRGPITAVPILGSEGQHVAPVRERGGMSRTLPPFGGPKQSRSPTIFTSRTMCTVWPRKSISSTPRPKASPCGVRENKRCAAELAYRVSHQTFVIGTRHHSRSVTDWSRKARRQPRLLRQPSVARGLLDREATPSG